jgi:hypothetical protein
MTHALIANGLVVQVDAATFDVNPALVWADITAITPAPQVGWSATQTSGAWTFAAPAAPPGPTIQQQAQVALDKSDMTSTRCFKAGVAFPADWQTYCVALRAIVNGTASPMPTALPALPAYPAGT